MMKLCAAFMLLIAVAYAANLDKDAQVLRYDNVVDPEGTYQWAYDTSNGISANEQGEGGVRATGGFRYVSPEGENIDVSYVADDNGFQPNNLPEPPAVPPLILRALDYLAANAQKK